MSLLRYTSVLLALIGCSSAPAGGDALRSHSPGRVAGADPAPSLLLRGWIAEDSLVLEPVFRIDAPPVPARAGAGGNRVLGFDAGGRTLFDVGVETAAMADHSGEEHFSTVVGLRSVDASLIARVELRSGDGRSTSRGATMSLDELTRILADPNATGAQRQGEGRVLIHWPGERLPYLLVRDARTGGLLSFAEGSEAVLMTTATSLELILSDGVQSVTVRLPLP